MKIKHGVFFGLAVIMMAAVFTLTGCGDSGSGDPTSPPGPDGSFTVTFNSNGGATEANPRTKTVTPPATTIDALPIAPTRSGGYTFSGWNTAANGTGTTFNETTTVTASITVYAKWTQGSSFNADALAAELAAVSGNSTTNLYTVTLMAINISNVWGQINSTVQASGKYVILDLSACTATGNTISGQNASPTGNNMNIIQDNQYIKGIILPDTLTSIGNHAFASCTDLTSVDIPDGVTSIGEFAFSYCTDLTSIITPNSVTSIGRYAFDSCSKMTSVTISANVTRIEDDTFARCGFLISVTFAEGSNISSENFSTIAGGNSTYGPTDLAGISNEGNSGSLRRRYLDQSATIRAGTYTRSGTTWTKQQ
jgi:uncharacterized repeat protein (TIGR02543 family)